MRDAVIIEPDPVLRNSLRQRLAALEERVAIVRDLANARVELLSDGGARLLVARLPSCESGMVATDMAGLVPRLVVLDPGAAVAPSLRAACAYLLEVERIIAALLFPLPETRASQRLGGAWTDWPVDLYVPLEQAGSGAVLARDRMTGSLHFVADTRRGDGAATVLHANFLRHATPWSDIVRHITYGARQVVAAQLPRACSDTIGVTREARAA